MKPSTEIAIKTSNTAVAKNEKCINLYTKSENVNFEKIAEIEDAMKRAKKGFNISKLPTDFDIDIEKVFRDIDLDTFMFLSVKHEKQPKRDLFEDKYLLAFSFTNSIVRIYSVKLSINLLPNDVTQII